MDSISVEELRRLHARVATSIERCTDLLLDLQAEEMELESQKNQSKETDAKEAEKVAPLTTMEREKLRELLAADFTLGEDSSDEDEHVD